MTTTRSKHETSLPGRAREAAGETAALAFNMAVRGVAAAIDWRERRRERNLLSQGLTEDPRESRQLGYPAERSRAFKSLFDALEQKAGQYAAWEIETPQVVRPQDKYCAPGFAGSYYKAFFYDQRPEGAGKTYVVQRHLSELGQTDFTLFELGELNPDNTRSYSTVNVARVNWDSATPWLDRKDYLRVGDHLDDALLTGSLFTGAEPISSGESIRSTGYEMLSAAKADNYAELVSNLKPISR